MRDFPSCFGEQGVQVADSFANGGKLGTQKLVTCYYKANLAGEARVITVNWCKTLGGQGLSVNVDDTSSECTCKVDMKPWLFWKKKGSKTLEVGEHKVEIFWDLSAAKYGSSPEPIEGFYLAVVCAQEMVLLLGNMSQEGYKKSLPSTSISSLSCETSLIARREHIFGKTFYSTQAQFGDGGRSHEILIECQTAGKEPRLCVRVDKQPVVQVKRLMWKFRGNQTIVVDGFPVELSWDVHNWLFNPSDNRAVFMFQISPSRSDQSQTAASTSRSKSVFQQQDQHDRTSIEPDKEGYGFCLLLYAWKSE